MKKRRIFSIFCISFLIFAFSLLSGCSSFDKSGIKNALDDYFEWFDDTINEDENEKNKGYDEKQTDGSENSSFLVIVNEK